MKKIIAVFLVLIMAILALTSCDLFKYKENKWFSSDMLNECLVPGLPEIGCSYLMEGDKDVYVKFTESEFNAYVTRVYEYLKSRGFDYLGTRGELQSSLSGAFNTYYFQPATDLSEFYVEGSYRFVYSDGIIANGNGELTFCILTIYNIGFEGVETLEYSRKNFDYNTVIKLRFNSEAPLGGRYVLKNHEHTYEFICNEKTHYKMYTCGCPSTNIAEIHNDTNNDYLCDECNYPVSNSDCPFEWVRTETGHRKLALCDCCKYPGREYPHVNYDADLQCDVCGYTINPPTPTNYFLRDLTGAEWIRDITADDIAEIKIISQDGMVSAGCFKYISSSDNKATISRIFENYYWLDMQPVDEEKTIVCDGGLVTVCFIMNDGTVKDIKFNNGEFYEDASGNYYELLYLPVFNDTNEYKSYYGFITHVGTGTVYSGGTITCEISIDELEFVELTDESANLPTSEKYVVKTEFGNLIFFTDDIFYIDFDFCGDSHNNVKYQLIGKNLDELITMALSPDYSVTMNDEEWLYEDLKATYRAGEVVSVKIGKAYDLGYLFLVNGEKILPCDEDLDLPYWEFVFTMPSSDVVIDFKTYDGFLPDMNYAVLIEACWIKNPDAEHVSVERYYGEYGTGAIVAMIGGFCDDVLWEEEIENTTIHYNNSNRIIALYGGEFYTLTEAYEAGYLSYEDIVVIAEKHENY